MKRSPRRQARAARRRSGATTPATAEAARSTRSATAADRTVDHGTRAAALSARPSNPHSRRLSADLARLGVAAFLVSAAFASYTALRIWQVGARDDRPTRADAIVVLGASQEHGRPLAVLRARLDHAIALHETGVARYFVVTGGTAEGDESSEAEAARVYAIENGVPSDAILAETAGTDTLSSLLGVQQLFREQAIATGIFVSDSTHLFRVLRMARDLGMTAYGSPATDSPIDQDALSRTLAIGREVLATAEYLLLSG